ncbi:UDP-glucose--hexose-1-phosphate uridylyltransferase [Aquibacillus halophilus]|uniref:Galactose-1-phosphate uridylyltransferase n=1 Tax=Aquibacillus halophilus TaxID=930132 RepID=A0A6A8DIC8_9BACI|nr:UDP-glucose--hexose-1-phosphate uridylyltransferase [Aquibacillus halophilus]MRH44216.1 UDP-glucose--hexose-1-phosphate uridylyltransferase [Aquibacillus halophilus]
MSIFLQVAQLVEKGVEAQLIEREDTIYIRNQLLGLLNLKGFEEVTIVATEKSIPDLLEDIVSYAITEEVIEDVLDDKEILSAKLMDCFLSKPSEVNQTFYSKYEDSPEQATNYFYNLSKSSNYIQMNRIKKNIHYKTESPYGSLDITINLSKPEKDPEQLKRERAMKQKITYPKCLLCIENEGYVGRTGHPARSNHRIINVPLEGEDWFLQYSPYVYYNEHCILLCADHREMKINKGTFQRLTAFVEKFPHYFVGSNADLPIVGGSILSHDHYQGGHYTFAMTDAKEEFFFKINQFDDVDASIVNWPLSVIRLRAKDRNKLIDAATHILDKWRGYSDTKVEIQAFTDDTPHNTITPIARVRDGLFELDLVLRNNRTTEEHPLGIFHPHQDVHHIKKENIGLIEVMGLAVLPDRLKYELEEIRRFLLDNTNHVTDYHENWAQEIKEKYSTTVDPKSVDRILEDELGKKFTKVLEDSGVFKTNKEGRAAFEKFITALN